MKKLLTIISLAALLVGCNRQVDVVTSSNIRGVEMNKQVYDIGSLPVVNGNYKIATVQSHGVSTWKLTAVPAFSFWGSFECWILIGALMVAFGGISLAFFTAQIPSRSAWIVVAFGLGLAAVGYTAIAIGWLPYALLALGLTWAGIEFIVHHKALVVKWLAEFKAEAAKDWQKLLNWIGNTFKGFWAWILSKLPKKASAPSVPPVNTTTK